jgi:hypothetical protein
MLAARGVQKLDAGIQQVQDTQLRERLRGQAKRVLLQSFAAAAILTVLFLMLPL